jgi:hypothetical protein
LENFSGFGGTSSLCSPTPKLLAEAVAVERRWLSIVSGDERLSARLPLAAKRYPEQL